MRYLGVLNKKKDVGTCIFVGHKSPDWKLEIDYFCPAHIKLQPVPSYKLRSKGPPLLWRNHAEELLIRVLSLLVYVEGLLGDLLEVAAAKTCSALVTNCTGVPSTFTELTYLEYSPRNSCLALPWQQLV